jgi:hypothetical protein
MPGLVPGIHVLFDTEDVGGYPAMTKITAEQKEN